MDGARDTFTDLEIQRCWEQNFDDYRTKTGLGWKTVARDRPAFDAGLKDFATPIKAQSRKVKDGDDATWVWAAPTVSSGLYVKHKHG